MGADIGTAKPRVVEEAAMLMILTQFFGALYPVGEITKVLS